MQKTVLVVDDDPLFIELLTDILTTEEYEVLTARNGEEALDILDDRWADLIVSDIEMPVMDGISLYSRVRKTEQLKHIPFIFLSGTIDSAKLGDINSRVDAEFIRKADLVDELLPKVASLT